MRIATRATVLGAAFVTAGSVFAADCSSTQRTTSGPSTIGIAELYTSEGCDSCPPADKWFSTLNVKKDGVVPLAFHVDYWDYIGWKDRFANAAFSDRQRESVRRQGGRTSYTPQVMLNGQDMRPWSDQSRFSARVKSAPAPRANIALDYTVSGTGLDVALTATLAPTADRADAAVFLAITESNLSNRVTAGENRGVTLKHDHVVRAIYGPLSGEAKDRVDGKLVIKRPIVLGQDWKRGDLSLVSFVQNLRTGDIYQALSAPVCANL
ncbi:MAG: DUF1223 domain-containing protein [Burkholderiales bacterium]|nr:DUF1223 domain-containing protein [Burkholderiales bacterium]